MSLSVMLGLKPPKLPDGKTRTYNCPNDDDEIGLSVARKKSTGKSSGGMRYCQFSRIQALKRYGAAFKKLGGTATKSELAKILPEMDKATIYQYLTRHQGDTVKRLGKRNREYVWEWIFD